MCQLAMVRAVVAKSSDSSLRATSNWSLSAMKIAWRRFDDWCNALYSDCPVRIREVVRREL